MPQDLRIAPKPETSHTTRSLGSSWPGISDRQALPARLVVLGCLEADGEGGKRPDDPASECGNGAGVQATAEPRANADVGPRVEGHGLRQLRVKGLGPALRPTLAARPAREHLGQPPVRPDDWTPALVESQWPGGSRLDPAEQRARIRNEAEQEELVERARVERSGRDAGREDGLLLRREVETGGGVRIVERLDPRAGPARARAAGAKCPRARRRTSRADGGRSRASLLRRGGR